MSYRMADKFVQLARKSTHVYTEFERWPIIWKYPIFRSAQFEQFFIVDALKENYPSEAPSEAPSNESLLVTKTTKLRGVNNDADALYE